MTYCLFSLYGGKAKSASRYSVFFKVYPQNNCKKSGKIFGIVRNISYISYVIWLKRLRIALVCHDYREDIGVSPYRKWKILGQLTQNETILSYSQAEYYKVKPISPAVTHSSWFFLPNFLQIIWICHIFVVY